MSYREMLNLARTDFAIRRELSEREPELEKLLKEQDDCRKSLDGRAPNGEFILHDGPPYSNGHLNKGHALNKALKDFVVRHESMTSHHCPYLAGCDDHGMPIEVEVLGEFRMSG